jgi:hypothetical protein
VPASCQKYLLECDSFGILAGCRSRQAGEFEAKKECLQIKQILTGVSFEFPA